MEVWKWITLYFLVGVFFITPEWIMLRHYKEGIFHPEEGDKRLLVRAMCFMIEVIIWPRQVFIMLAINVKAFVYGYRRAKRGEEWSTQEWIKYYKTSVEGGEDNRGDS